MYLSRSRFVKGIGAGRGKLRTAPTTLSLAKGAKGLLVLKPRHAPRRNGYAERIVNRNPGTRLPVYLDMYDAATIAKVDDLVHRYMADSRNFTSSTMPRCNGYPKGP